MSLIYLAITLSFIIILFRQDKKEWLHFSFALWVPLLWLLTSTTRLVQILIPIQGFSRGVSSVEASIEGNPISRMISIALILSGVVVLIKRKSALSAFIRDNRGIFVLYAYVLLTIAWSDYPGVSIKRYIRICGSLLMAFIVASEEDHIKSLEHIVRRYAATCLPLSLFFVRTNRSIGYVIGEHGEYFMSGIAAHKNELGILCMFSLVFLFYRAMALWPSVNYLDAILLLIDIYFLIRAQCTTALVLAMLGTAIMIVLKITSGSFRKIAFSVAILVVVALPILIITLNSPSDSISGAFFSATGKDATLSGRIPMWQDLIRIGKKDIILGTGYESYWLDHYREVWELWSFKPNTAHNGFVEVLLNIGFVGLTIVIIIILRSLFLLASKQSISRPWGRWSLVLLILFIISNVTEASLTNLSLGWSFFLMISVTNEKSGKLQSPSLIGSVSVFE